MKVFAGITNRIVLPLYLFLFLFSLTISLSAQKRADNQQKKNIYQFSVWQQRVDVLTDGVIKDSSSISESERAVYLAVLAKMWWQIKPEEAKRFLQKSVKLVVNSLESNEAVDLAIRISNFQKVSQIASKLDKNSNRILLEQFVKITTEKAKNSEKNADTLIFIALQIVEENPQQAFEIGSKALIFGNPIQIVRLIGELNIKDTRLAERLFRAALYNAENNYNLRFISRLSVAAFSEYKDKALSESSRQSFLIMLAEMVSRASIREQDKQSACEIVVVASPIIDKFDVYLSDSAQTVRRQIQSCQPFLPKSYSALVESELKDDKHKTVEELIRAAREASDKFLKLTYYYEAINKFGQAKKFDEVLSLLSDITEEEREILGKDTLGNYNCDSWYEEYAFLSAAEHIKTGDLPSAYKIISRAPKKTRPSVRINLAFKLSSGEQQAFIIEMLEKAREELNSMDLPAVKIADYYLSLISLYAQAQPYESEAVFREAVKAIDKADKENPDNKPEKDYAPLKDYISLPAKLLEVNEINVLNGFEAISSRRSRVRLKLGLLESSLVSYVKERKKLELENKEILK